MIYRVIISRGGPVSGEVGGRTLHGRIRAWAWAVGAWLHGWRIVAVYPVRKS